MDVIKKVKRAQAANKQRKMSMIVDRISSLDKEIAKARSSIRCVKNLRDSERRRFTDNEEGWCLRQHYCTQELGRLLPHKAPFSSVLYARSIRTLSDTKSLYVMSQETKLCEALHSIEVVTNQSRIQIAYHNTLALSFEAHLNQIILPRTAGVANGLRNRILLTSNDIQRLKTLRENILSVQQQENKNEVNNKKQASSSSLSLIVTDFMNSTSIMKLKKQRSKRRIGGVFKTAKAA